MATRVGLYSRVSTDRQKTDDTIASQQAALRRYASEQGWEIVADEADNGVSGVVAPNERPGMGRLCDRIRAGDLDILLVLDMTRLSRDDTGLHVPVFRAFLKDHHVRLWTVAGEHAIESPIDQLIAAVHQFRSAEERRSIRERTVRGRRYAIERGGRGHGVHLVGYRWCAQQKREVPDPAQRDLVREIFRLAAEERLGPYAISRRLRERGLTGGRRTFLFEDAIKRILLRETYHTGLYRPEPQAMPNLVRLVEPLVDQETWFSANEVLSTGRRQPPERQTRYLFMLRGRIRCIHCGGAMTAQCSAGRYPYYRCPKGSSKPLNKPRCVAGKGIRADRVDQAVWATVAELLRDPDALRREVERAAALAEGSIELVREELVRVEEEIARLDAERKRLASALLRDVLTEDDVRDERARIERAKAPLARQRDRLSAQVNAVGVSRARVNLVEDRLDVLRRTLDTLTPDERAAVVGEIVDVVRVDTATGDITVEAIVLTGGVDNEPPPRTGDAGRSSGGGPRGPGIYGAQDSWT